MFGDNSTTAVFIQLITTLNQWDNWEDEVVTLTSIRASLAVCYLSNQTGEHKDAHEKISHLKGNLKDGMGLVKTPDVDQTADGKVVTTQVPVKRAGALEGP